MGVTELSGKTEAWAEGLARELIQKLAGRHYTLALAESCTAGLVSDLLARVSGASAVLWGSFVSYTPGAKQRMLGIDDGFLRQHGLVSPETAREMALRVLDLAGVSIAAAVTGLAGPSGSEPEYSGGSDTPIGTVWIAVAGSFFESPDGNCRQKKRCFKGTRAEIRIQAAAAVLEELLAVVNRSLDK